MKERSNQNVVSLESIQLDWQRALNLQLRERFKAFRAIAHDLVVAVNEQENSVSTLESYVQIMQGILSQSRGQADLSRLHSAMANAQRKICLEILGREPNVVQKAKKILVTDTANFLIADSMDKESALLLSEVKALECINRGEFFAFNTKADGRYLVTVFLVDVPEPILPTRDMSKMDGALDSAIISCRTGFMHVFGGGSPGLSISVESGNYRVRTYFRESDVLSFYVVMAKCDEAPENSLMSLSCPF